MVGRPLGSEGRVRHAATIPTVSLPQISWLVTVLLCLVSAVLLLVEGYVGYFGVALAVGAAAAVNLR